MDSDWEVATGTKVKAHSTSIRTGGEHGEDDHTSFYERPEVGNYKEKIEDRN